MGRIDENDRRIATEGSPLLFEHNETRKTLEMLRKTRAARGGVGAPLTVPGHLRDAAAGQGVVITDADLSPNSRKTQEEEDDTNSDTAQRIHESEKE